MRDFDPEAEPTILATARLLCLNEDALPALRFLYLFGKTAGVIEACHQHRAELREVREAA